MKHPAYHLRFHKSADRFVFIEAINRLAQLDQVGLADYTYFGLGGPYLEDFRLLYEYCPNIAMVSIENDLETFKRQMFHRPCVSLSLVFDELSEFITKYDPDGKKSVFWLDYTRLLPSHLGDFQTLLTTVVELSMVKITLRCEPSDFRSAIRGKSIACEKKVKRFQRNFANFISSPDVTPPTTLRELANLLQSMIRVAVEQALPASATSVVFVPVSSFYYTDGTGMFTLTGIVCNRSDVENIVCTFGDWLFANFDWDEPKHIEVPVLSTKERLLLQELLPAGQNAGEKLSKYLGYYIDYGKKRSESALEKYALFHRYFPYIMRSVP